MSKYKFTDTPSEDSGRLYKPGNNARSKSRSVVEKINDDNALLLEKTSVASYSPNPKTTKVFPRIRRYNFSKLPKVPENEQIKLESFQRLQLLPENRIQYVSESIENYVYFGHAEGEESASVVRTQLESEGLNVKDCERDGIFGKPEKHQTGKLMENATWIILYFSGIDCDEYLFDQGIAIDIAKEQKLKKIICLVSSSKVKLTPDLRVFPTEVMDGDWVSRLRTVVEREPNKLQRGEFAIHNYPLSTSLESVQSDNVDVAKRLYTLGKTGFSSSTGKVISQKNKWESIQK